MPVAHALPGVGKNLQDHFLARVVAEVTGIPTANEKSRGLPFVGEIMRYVDGPIAPVDCVSRSPQKECEFHGECHFFGFWGRMRQAISDVVDRTTFADLVARWEDDLGQVVPGRGRAMREGMGARRRPRSGSRADRKSTRLNSSHSSPSRMPSSA